jgi:hypothetical protein
VSAFVGHGKKTAWAAWNSFPELTTGLLAPAHGPTEIPQQAMQVIERFVILTLDKIVYKMRCGQCGQFSCCIAKARKKLFM